MRTIDCNECSKLIATITAAAILRTMSGKSIITGSPPCLTPWTRRYKTQHPCRCVYWQRSDWTTLERWSAFGRRASPGTLPSRGTARALKRIEAQIKGEKRGDTMSGSKEDAQAILGSIAAHLRLGTVSRSVADEYVRRIDAWMLQGDTPLSRSRCCPECHGEAITANNCRCETCDGKGYVFTGGH
jgi:hypothetical protein